MNYQPLALKYRPGGFADVVGQEAVATTLRNAIREQRLANAFLFTGSRGTGKTSTARILSKALNCPNVKDAEPCNACETCAAISIGEDIDVLEIDGASNRGIDEIRQIRDNVQYLPARSRFKIYIIDEVHMLTAAAFNALLKTLEEPPPHVKFILATTEFQAVPETIVSRCQRFDFRRITLDDLVGRLRHICKAEGIEAGDDVLRAIAEKSEGGLRDSISLLDQVVSFSGPKLNAEAVDAALGLVDVERLRALLLAVAAGDTAQVLTVLDDTFASGRDAEGLLSQILDLFRAALAASVRELPRGAAGKRSALVDELRAALDVDRLLFSLRLLLNTWREIKLAGWGRLQVEVALVKLARSVDLVPWSDVIAELDRGAEAPAASASGATPPQARPRPSVGVPPQAKVPPPSAAASTAPASDLPPLAALKDAWGTAKGVFQARHPKVAAMLEGADVARAQGGGLVLGLPAGRAFLQKSLEADAQRDVVEGVLGEVLGVRPAVRYEFGPAAPRAATPKPAAGMKKDVHADPAVRKVVDALGGGVIHVEGSKPSG